MTPTTLALITSLAATGLFALSRPRIAVPPRRAVRAAVAADPRT